MGRQSLHGIINISLSGHGGTRSLGRMRRPPVSSNSDLMDRRGFEYSSWVTTNGRTTMCGRRLTLSTGPCTSMKVQV